MLNDFFCLSLQVCMLHQWLYQLFDTVLFKLKKFVQIFKFVAGVNREFIWEFIFCLCNTFLLLSTKFRCGFVCVQNPFSVCIGS